MTGLSFSINVHICRALLLKATQRERERATQRERERERERERVSTLLGFISQPPPSVFITAMSLISLTFLANSGFSEIRGKHYQYSKFWNVNSQKSAAKQIKVSSRTGMLLLYTPAFLAGLASFGIFHDEGFRFLLLNSAVTIHFFKRVLEVLFVHKYSGAMSVDDAIPISVSYFLSAASMIYAQHLSRGFPEPSIDLKYPGIVLFLMGISGNLNHHYLLSKLREEGDKEYKIPKGGLFDWVICPHYLFEILGFIGVSFISQTLYAFCYTMGTTVYLMGRSYATKRWYLSKFEDFPKDVKALIPYVF